MLRPHAGRMHDIIVEYVMRHERPVKQFDVDEIARDFRIIDKGFRFDPMSTGIWLLIYSSYGAAILAFVWWYRGG